MASLTAKLTLDATGWWKVRIRGIALVTEIKTLGEI
jgi:hypothetical protein